MSSLDRNLSMYETSQLPSAKNMKFGIVVSDYHTDVTFSMKDAAVELLIKQGASEKNINIKYVPGSFELIHGAQLYAEHSDVDAIICLGCVIQGETRHFEFICNTVADKIAQLGIDYNMPIIFGVLTPNNKEQAIERSGGKMGNKGIEAAIAAIRMVALKEAMESEFD